MTPGLTIRELEAMLPAVGQEKGTCWIAVRCYTEPGWLCIEMFRSKAQLRGAGLIRFFPSINNAAAEKKESAATLVASVVHDVVTNTYKLGVPISHSEQEWGLEARVGLYILDQEKPPAALAGWDDDPFDLGRARAWPAN